MKINSPKKVAIIGPECTGKSDLAQFLASHFGTSWVREYAREYLNKLGRPYQELDLIEIARGQVQAENNLLSSTKRVLICDTNLMVIKIWSYIKYGRCGKDILEIMNSRFYDLYLLTFIDIPWQADPQREHPDRREEIWAAYKNELKKQDVPYVEIKGSRATRRLDAIRAITGIIGD